MVPPFFSLAILFLLHHVAKLWNIAKSPTLIQNIYSSQYGIITIFMVHGRRLHYHMQQFGRYSKGDPWIICQLCHHVSVPNVSLLNVFPTFRSTQPHS